MRNNLELVISHLSRPQQKCLKTLVRQVFIKKTPVLRHLAMEDELLVPSQTRRFSRHLEHIDLEKTVDKLALNKAKKMMQKDTTIAYDLCDIAKDNAKVMENLSRVFDGNKRKSAPGYFLHGVGAADILLQFNVHNADADTLNKTRKKIIFKINEHFQNKGIWVMDRGNDGKQFFRDLALEGVRFICRLRNNRHVVMEKTGEKVAIKDIAPGKYNVYLLDRNNNNVKTDVAYTLVIQQHLDHKEPIRLLSNLCIEKYSAEGFVEKYLERWGVEKKFRTIKTKFMLEKIRVLSWKRFVNLVALIRLCLLLAHLLYQRLIEHERQIFLNLFHLIQSFKAFIKRKALTQNPDSFITFLGHYLPPFVARKIPDSPNISLFSSSILKKLSPS
jgi:hypothetical protein